MNKRWTIGVVGLCSMLASAASADETGVEVGVRSGYAIPLGDSTEAAPLNDFVSGVVPLWLDLGYRATPNIMIGAYFQYGFGFIPDNADFACDVADCSAHNMRLGAQLHYHFMPWEKVDPWLGAGIGYEWAKLSAEATILNQKVEQGIGVHGFEFLNLQGGMDFMPGDANFGLGPFLSLSLAQFGSCSFSGVLESEGDCEIQDKALHQWLTLGVRGTFVP